MKIIIDVNESKAGVMVFLGCQTSHAWNLLRDKPPGTLNTSGSAGMLQAFVDILGLLRHLVSSS